VSEGFAVRDDVMRDMAGEMEAANRNAISAKGVGLEAHRIARLIRGETPERIGEQVDQKFWIGTIRYLVAFGFRGMPRLKSVRELSMKKCVSCLNDNPLRAGNSRS
jgi:hypothetical protein